MVVYTPRQEIYSRCLPASGLISNFVISKSRNIESRNIEKNKITMKLKKGFILREVCGEHVITGEGLTAVNFGRLLALNETAAWLWKQAEEMGDFTIEQLADKLCEEYEVSNDVAKEDVAKIIGQWQKEGVIE